MIKSVLCLTLACVIGYSIRTELTIDPELTPYYNKYNQMINAHCNNDKYFHPRVLVIEFADLEWPTIGLASWNYFGMQKLQLDKTFWKNADQNLRSNVYAHESTHTFFHAPHVQDPTNYMAPVITYLTEYELHNQVNQFLIERCGK